MEIQVNEKILSKNDLIALETRKLLDQHKILCINLMSSPGSGKTTLLEKTIPMLPDSIKIGVIEGDVATHIDAQRIESLGVPTVQITTDLFGGSCHLSAKMIAERVKELPLEKLNLVVIENVGNLICPAGFQVGAHKDVVVISLTEGAEKPLKYPAIFEKSHLVLVNKIDLAEALEIEPERIAENVRTINPKVEQIPLSAKTGEGIDRLIDWIKKELP